LKKSNGYRRSKVEQKYSNSDSLLPDITETRQNKEKKEEKKEEKKKLIKSLLNSRSGEADTVHEVDMK